MKNKIALLLLGIVVSLASCTTEPPEPPTPGNYDPLSIEIAATTLNQATRSIIDEQGDPETGRSNIKTKLQTTDQIGIYVQFKDELDRSGDYKVSTIEDNGSTARFTGPFKWKDSGLPHMFYAYYPKIVSPAGTPLEDQPDYDPTMIPISLPAVQQQIAAGNEHGPLYKSDAADEEDSVDDGGPCY